MKKTPEPTTDEQLGALLRELGLGFFAENFAAAVAAAAKNGVPYAELLASLARGESEARFGRSVQRRLHQARLPFLRTMDGFDWTHPRSINRAQVEQLMRLQFLQDKGNVLILGPVGVGKTHIASCLARKACEKGVSTLFVQAVDIVNDLSAACAANRLLHGLRKYTSPALLCIDELGYLPLDDRGAQLLFQVCSKRYEKSSTIVTTNTEPKKWGAIFNGNAMTASAILDRLLHHSTEVVIDGESYRARERAR